MRVAAGDGFATEFSAVHVGFDPKHSFVSAEESDLQQLRDIFEGGPDAMHDSQSINDKPTAV